MTEKTVKKECLAENYPHLREFFPLLDALNKESHRGAVLIACSYLDSQLRQILAAFMASGSSAKILLEGFNAPLGTFSARIAACSALGLLTIQESRECDLLRKIRNEFAHKVDASFEAEKIVYLTKELRFSHTEFEEPFGRFNTAAVGLILNLTNRPHYVAQTRRTPREWPR